MRLHEIAGCDGNHYSGVKGHVKVPFADIQVGHRFTGAQGVSTYKKMDDRTAVDEKTGKTVNMPARVRVSWIKHKRKPPTHRVSGPRY